MKAAEVRSNGRYATLWKRMVDILISACLLLVLAPAIFLMLFFVSIESQGSPLFVQTRVGLSGCRFRLYKIRTMTNEARIVGGEIFGAQDGVTRVGYWLRRFKLDELPQLWNVLVGDMSLVGPRPCMPELLESLSQEALWRFKVRPGLTGLAQVSGNIYLSWDERWRLDRRYVERISASLDAWILMRTILVLVLGEERFKEGR